MFLTPFYIIGYILIFHCAAGLKPGGIAKS